MILCYFVFVCDLSIETVLSKWSRRKLKPNERKQELARLIDEQRSKNVDDMYNLVRLLLPKFDTERQTYGLKEATIPKVLSMPISLNVSNNLNKGINLN